MKTTYSTNSNLLSTCDLLQQHFKAFSVFGKPRCPVGPFPAARPLCSHQLGNLEPSPTLLYRERPISKVYRRTGRRAGGFRGTRSATQQILILRLRAEKAKRKGKLGLIDFRKALDSIKQSSMTLLWQC